MTRGPPAPKPNDCMKWSQSHDLCLWLASLYAQLKPPIYHIYAIANILSLPRTSFGPWSESTGSSAPPGSSFSAGRIRSHMVLDFKLTLTWTQTWTNRHPKHQLVHIIIRVSQQVCVSLARRAGRQASKLLLLENVQSYCVLFVFSSYSFSVWLLFRAFSPWQSSYLTRSPTVWSSSKISNEFLHTDRDCKEGDPPGTINTAYVLWATQLEQFASIPRWFCHRHCDSVY